MKMRRKKKRNSSPFTNIKAPLSGAFFMRRKPAAGGHFLPVHQQNSTLISKSR
jgi:hypothetical protein